MTRRGQGRPRAIRFARNSGLWLILAGALAVPAPAAARTAIAVHGPASDWEATMLEAQKAFEAGEYAQAAEGYTAAYQEMSPEQRKSFGDLVVPQAMSAHERAYAETKNVEHLQQAIDLLEQRATDLEDAGAGDTSEARQVARERDRIAGLLPVEPEPNEEEPDSEEPKATPPTTDRDVDPAAATTSGAAASQPTGRGRDRGPRDSLGLGLTVGGSVLLAGGIGLLIAAPLQVPYAEDLLADLPEPTPDEPGCDAACREETRSHYELRRNVYYGVGAASAALGAAALIWGSVRLAGAKKNRVSVVPQLSPSMAGLRLHLRF